MMPRAGGSERDCGLIRYAFLYDSPLFECVLVTHDRNIAKYDVPVVKIGSRPACTLAVEVSVCIGRVGRS